MYKLFEEHDMKLNCFEQVGNGFKRIQRQQTFIRTNCLDCLDRTNAVQAKLAFLAYLMATEDEEKMNFYNG